MKNGVSAASGGRRKIAFRPQRLSLGVPKKKKETNFPPEKMSRPRLKCQAIVYHMQDKVERFF
ncbi:hypothetical protein [Pyramidobacter piscolens]|uniref:hypothetical protein n=1 Tax=Pyramidobacter piscolens TaxID=638849 RepID=UPI002667025E|nr:hypothetical protein [Pyramidobacter piscolens]